MLLLILVYRRRPVKNSLHEETYNRIEAIVKSLTDIAQEHEKISKQFEANLEAKKTLIMELTTRLDNLIGKAREVILQLEKMIEESKSIEKTAPFKIGNPEHERIINLAKKGFTLQSIAQQVNKPVGEVELIINLYKAAMKKREFND